MSVDAKLFVTCGKEKLFDVLCSVSIALKDFIRTETNKVCYGLTFGEIQEFKKANNYKQLSCDATNPEIFYFTFGVGELRSLGMFPTCSCDYTDIYKGDKIIFSLGCWGMYNEIMMIVAKAVAPFGDVYYDFNDCDDQDFVKLENLNA